MNQFSSSDISGHTHDIAPQVQLEALDRSLESELFRQLVERMEVSKPNQLQRLQ